MIFLPESIRDLFRPHPGWYALGAALGLTLLGIMAITTADPQLAPTQTRWLVISLIAMLVCLLPHPRVISYLAYPFMGIALAFLIFLVLPGVPRSIVPKVNGAQAWIDLGGMRLQPSEFAKIAFVLTLGRYLRFRDSYRTIMGLLPPFVIMVVPVGLILKEPDLGTALLFAPALFAVLVAVGAKLRHLGALFAIAAVLIAINLVLVFTLPPTQHPFMKVHQVARIKSMVNLIQGEANTLDDAYQQNQAMNLVGAGQMRGFGAEQASLIVRFNYLPHDHNDMIYAVVINRWGLLGSGVLLGLYFVLIAAMIITAARSKDPFARVACVGFAAMLFAQITINIGMNVGLLPITGITLPFVSYGGSSLMSSFMMVGLVFNFASRRSRWITRPSFEYDHADALFQ
jgi:cell division protein FtsW (lipid II flippase)